MSPVINNPKVSVVLPCYNAGKYIEQAVRSMMVQTYRNLEIIIVDDCSADESADVLKRLAMEDSRIMVLHNETNLKIVACLNKAIDIASGKYIARMDADDISMPDRIAKQIAFLEANENIAACGCNYIIIDEVGNKTGKVLFESTPDLLKPELLFFSALAHPAVTLRTAAAKEAGLYKPGMVPAEDYEFWLSIAEKFEMANLPEYLLLYRWHGNNVSVVQKKNLTEAMTKACTIHLDSFGFAGAFLYYHVKFLNGTWYMATNADEINGFAKWKKALVKKNEEAKLFDSTALRKTFDKYYSLALLSILKSRQNSLSLKLLAFTKLISINPFITAKHFLTR